MKVGSDMDLSDGWVVWREHMWWEVSTDGSERGRSMRRGGWNGEL